MDTEEKLIETLTRAGKPMRSGEIAQATKLDKKEVEKAIKVLVKQGKLFSPVRCFYDIKK
ncbi:MAG TPA: MarR family transcriptional regulator [Bacteroidales bacterium]|jgi:predicted transcriptional regulator|nr:MarR family transcriptional regulator [Bacteroidales bacterium]MDI9573659.1 MarR family transcriptional regulator [Bacteroidota bacterium]OQC62027.1 MAG: hypothetical protein BWX51_00173 [Bacteroidetes bacterium ADurb.Bin012]MBP9511011.1 MarR family transcriptional regulator [Bacteroidales bacterium]MBP9587711.1 MarR family transcriptional regulator [Bacteroidales bacterium]